MGKFVTFLGNHRVVFIVVAAVLVAAIVVVSCLSALIFSRYSQGVLPTDEDLAQAYKYDHVVIFGVDGVGRFYKDATTPNFDRIFENGSVTYDGMSQYPTTSAHNWTSILHGVRYQKHKVNNEVAEKQTYDGKYPSIFSILQERRPGETSISAASWAPINHGIVEDLPSVIKLTGDTLAKNAGLDDPLEEAADAMMTEELCALLQDTDPLVTYIHLGQADEYGHYYGSNAREYYDSMTVVDALIGTMYDTFIAKGYTTDNTLFIFVTDHGQQIHTGHGFNSPRERQVTVAFAGTSVKKGTPGKIVTHDIAAIVLYALGEKQPDYFEGRVPHGIFTTLE